MLHALGTNVRCTATAQSVQGTAQVVNVALVAQATRVRKIAIQEIALQAALEICAHKNAMATTVLLLVWASIVPIIVQEQSVITVACILKTKVAQTKTPPKRLQWVQIAV